MEFFKSMKSRGLSDIKMVIGYKCLGILESIGDVYPEAKYLCCIVHFYRNIFFVVSHSKMKSVAQILKAIHNQERKKAAREKGKAVIEEFRQIKLKEAADKLEKEIEGALTCRSFPYEHWLKICTTNLIERINREIRR